MSQAVASLSDLNARLVLIGEVARDIRDELALEPHIDLLGWRPPDEVHELLGTARIGLCVLHPVRNYVESLPTKLFEYMDAGLPVVASDFPAWREIVNGAGCGLLVDPLDPAGIARALRYLLTNPDRAQTMGERGRAAVRKDYQWEREAESLLRLYDRLAPRRRPETS